MQKLNIIIITKVFTLDHNSFHYEDTKAYQEPHK